MKPDEELGQLVESVQDMLNQIVQRRGRDKKVGNLKNAIILSLWLAYHMGQAHALNRILREIKGGNHHGPQEEER